MCFDKDGIIIDVHAYWNHNSHLRAEYLTNKLRLDNSLIGQLLGAMGIDGNSGLIKEEGPVGYHPREIVINSTVEFLKHYNEEVTFTEISTMFMEVDIIQQEKDDYKIKLLEGVKDCLQWLKEKEMYISVYTSDRRLNAEKILDKVGLGNLFDTVVGGDDVNAGKPDPEGFLKACNELDVNPNNSAYVGDTVSDMIMGKNGGAAMVVGLETGLFTSSELQKNTEYIYPSMIEFNVGIQQYL